MASKNTLTRYLERQGPGSIAALQMLVRKRARRKIRWQTLQDIAHNGVRPRVETAQLLHRVTDGEVDAADLLGLTVAPKRAAAAHDTAPAGTFDAVTPTRSPEEIDGEDAA